MRVLIVEDEKKFSLYLKRGLEENGYAVDLAYDGQEALDWAESVSFDLIVLDILLPKIDGLVVCKRLRERGKSTPILMLTALDTVDDRVEGLDAGADDYLIKPFATKELLARMRALIRRMPDQHRDTRLSLADLEMDPVSYRVSRAGRSVNLTPKEYAVLECLFRANGRVVTRTMIAEHVWNYEEFKHSNVVDVYIRNLRRKIDTNQSLKLLHTIRGAGYRLSVERDDGVV